MDCDTPPIVLSERHTPKSPLCHQVPRRKDYLAGRGASACDTLCTRFHHLVLASTAAHKFFFRNASIYLTDELESVLVNSVKILLDNPLSSSWYMLIPFKVSIASVTTLRAPFQSQKGLNDMEDYWCTRRHREYVDICDSVRLTLPPTELEGRAVPRRPSVKN